MSKLKEFLNLTYYTSPLDEFLAKFDETHPLSASQRKEKEKYARIYSRRDTPQQSEPKETFWDEF